MGGSGSVSEGLGERRRVEAEGVKGVSGTHGEVLGLEAEVWWSRSVIGMWSIRLELGIGLERGIRAQPQTGGRAGTRGS